VAVFESDNECESVFLGVFGSDFARHGVPGSTVEVFGANQDTCTGELVRAFDGRAGLADMQFVVSASGDSAVLMATVTVFDFVRNKELPIATNLRWTAVPGQPSFRHRTDRFQSSDFSNTRKFAFRGRDANVAGTILDDGVDYAALPLEGAGVSRDSEIELTRRRF
jgi:hypothetical protein